MSLSKRTVLVLFVWVIFLFEVGTNSPIVLIRPPLTFSDSLEHLVCAKGTLKVVWGWEEAKTVRNSRSFTVPAKNPCGPHTVALVHNHPKGERCWYKFPTTEILTSDGVAALTSRYRWDGIWCKNHFVWSNKP